MAHGNIVFRSDRFHSEVKCAHERDSPKNGSTIIEKFEWESNRNQKQGDGGCYVQKQQKMFCCYRLECQCCSSYLLLFRLPLLVENERSRLALIRASLKNGGYSILILLLVKRVCFFTRFRIQASSLSTRFRKSLSKILFRTVR